MENYNNIPKEKFTFVNGSDISHDKKLQTKPRSYMRDALSRFVKNKASVVAAIIVLIFIIFAIIGPYGMNQVYIDAYQTDTEVKNYQFILPKIKLFEGTGFWDGTKVERSVNQNTLYRYLGIEKEQAHNAVVDYTSYVVNGETVYDVRIDSYYTINVFTKVLTGEQYKELQDWQDENNIQVILPYVNYDNSAMAQARQRNLNVWYVCDQNGRPTLDAAGNLIPAYYTYDNTAGLRDDYTSKMRLADDPYNPALAKDDPNNHGWSYAQRTGTAPNYSYSVRLDAYNYFIYKYGFEPVFTFGTENHGYDIFSRLASGMRFSMLFALVVATINLIIGAIYGAIEGYYGGIADLSMERIKDVLYGLPQMIIVTLFNLHLTAKIGPVPALLYAFIVTGWLGMSGLTRVQFYRFKNQEYVLAARTLGASDWKIMWKHVFPNAIGTIITSSVLIIPGVIFSETTLTFLGIINLDSATQASVGAMLSAGQANMVYYPHMLIFPAVFLALLEISFNLFGNGLRDAFNPTLRGSEG